MKKIWWSIIIGLIILLTIFIFLNAKKCNIFLKIKEGKISPLSSSLFNQAKELEAQGNLFGAKAIYQRLINEFPNSSEVANWQKKIEDLNIKLLFSPVLTPNSVLYEIKPGDVIVKIAAEFKTTPELIMKSNGLANDRIFPGKKIKVWTAPFSILVDKSQNTLILKANEEIIKTYIVSTGINNSTPVGNFKIINKLLNPTWFKAGAVVPAGSPENILGCRWLGFDLAGYGIHGTTEPQSLGKQVTQGCVRMSNSDIEELYTIIPAGTEVTIVD
jgi:lipoprotein-anchoring transpeptidase ErfK/SrfK